MMQGVGLVLAGGYGTGAYHVGVWKALREFGIEQKVTAVAGASAGVLNAALFVQGDYYAAEKLWIDMSDDKTVTVGVRNLMGMIGAGGLSCKNSYGSEVFSRQGIESLFTEYVDLDSQSSSALEFIVTAYNWHYKSIKYFNIKGESSQRIKKIFLSSMAQPFISPKEEIDGDYFIDCGVVGHVPITPLYDVGVRNFIVVYDGHDYLVNNDKFADANIIEIVASKEKKLRSDKQDKRGGIVAQIDQGYSEAMQILKPIYELGLVQAKIAATLQGFYSAEVKYKADNESIIFNREMLKQRIDGSSK